MVFSDFHVVEYLLRFFARPSDVGIYSLRDIDVSVYLLSRDFIFKTLVQGVS